MSALFSIDELDFCAGEVGSCRDDIEPIEVNGFFHCAVYSDRSDQNIVQRGVQLRPLYSNSACRIPLRVAVYDQGFVFSSGEARR